MILILFLLFVKPLFAVQTVRFFRLFVPAVLTLDRKGEGSTFSLDNEKVVHFDFDFLTPFFCCSVCSFARLFVPAILTLGRKGGGDLLASLDNEKVVDFDC